MLRKAQPEQLLQLFSGQEEVMSDQKTVKMDSQDVTRGSGAAGEQPTVQVNVSPFVPLHAPPPRADQPTPRPNQPGWGPPAGNPAAIGDSPTMLISQRPSPVLAWLAVLDGPEKGRIHQLRPDVTTIGRAIGNDVVVPDNSVSSQHGKIKVEPQEGEEDQFVLFDLASSNGTFASDKTHYRDPGSRVYRHVLQDGDYVLLGETTLVFKRV